MWWEDYGTAPVNCAFTLDGGLSWTPGGVLPDFHDEYGQCSVCAGPGASYCVVNLRALTSTYDIEVHRGDIISGSLVWQPPAIVGSGTILEHPSIACDPATGGLYVSYTLGFSGAAIYFSRSGDAGVTWSAPTQLSPITCSGSTLAVGPADEVYLMWNDFSTGEVMLRRSLDHGVSFQPATVVGAILENTNSPPP